MGATGPHSKMVEMCRLGSVNRKRSFVLPVSGSWTDGGVLAGQGRFWTGGDPRQTGLRVQGLRSKNSLNAVTCQHLLTLRYKNWTSAGSPIQTTRCLLVVQLFRSSFGAKKPDKSVDFMSDASCFHANIHRTR